MATRRRRASTSIDTSTTPRVSRLAPWLPLLIVLVGVAAYANSFDGVFLLDDVNNIVKNEHIRDLTNIVDVLTHQRRPIVSLSFAINYAISRLDTWSYHAFNLLVHLLSGLMLYGIVRRTLLLERFRDRFGRSAPSFALAISLIWVAHPLLTQSVTYIVQRGESLMGLFYFLTLYAVIRTGTAAKPFVWSAVAVAACAAGMASKAVMISAPLVVLLFDVCFLSPSLTATLKRRWPLYVALFATATILAATGVISGVLFPQDHRAARVGFGYREVSPWAYLLTQSQVIWHYLRLCVWPAPLCFDYRWPVAERLSQVALPAIGILALLGGTVWAVVRRSWVGFIGLWFFAILAPTSSFIPIKDAAFEHRMYLPLAAVVTLTVFCVHAMIRAVAARFGHEARTRMISTALVIGTTCILAVATHNRNKVYADETTMWQDVLDQRPGHVRALYNLGLGYFNRRQYADAENLFRRALVASPDYVAAHQNLATCLQMQNRLDEAIAHFQRVVELRPDHWGAQFGLGTALARRKRFAEAEQHLKQAVEIQPTNPRGWNNLGNVYRDLQRTDDAIAAFREAIRQDPRYASAYFNLGRALRKQGHPSQAVAAFEKALAIQPNNARIAQALRTARSEAQR